ncbi:MAG: sensor domain-containing diguanylate cyclase [Actinomycetota bacterium]|nr:sensor domain-containing diguanylate cyclase [Actinomycetota bacterium]
MIGPFLDAVRRPRSGPAPDLTDLAERFGALLVVRIGIALTVLGVAALVPSAVGIEVAVVAPVTLAYMVFAVAAEWARRAVNLRVVNVQAVMLVVDVVYIALIMAPTGGPRSELVFLFYVHLIAVTLLGTHRTGLRIALCDSLLFIWLYSFSLNTRVGRLLGAVSVQHPSTSAIVLSILAFWLVAACTAFFSWVNERELRRSREELQALAEMAAAFELSSCPDDIMRALLTKSTEAFRFTRGAVLLSHPGCSAALVTGQDRPIELPAVRRDAVVDRAWAARGPVLVRALDVNADPTLHALMADARNIVVLPLTAGAEPLGALAVERGGVFGVRLPVRAVTMLAQFTAHTALAIRNARLRAEVERLAKEDGLTGIANRRVFEEVLGREVARAQRTKQPLCLVVLDVDHFKQVNDTLGHPAGDEVLRRVARSLATAAREIDLVARYGGEEFTVILPECSLEDGLRVAERMRSGVSLDAGAAGVTLSAGVACLPDNAIDAAGLIAAADEAMFKSKRAGRDRTTGSNQRGPTVAAVRR